MSEPYRSASGYMSFTGTGGTGRRNTSQLPKQSAVEAEHQAYQANRRSENGLEELTVLLPPGIREAVSALPPEVQAAAEELRIREGRPLEIITDSGHSFLAADGRLLEHPEQALCPSREDCGRLLELLTRHSIYSFEEELRRGFITVSGGHRVGLSGRTVLESGSVKLIRDVSGFNVRIAREVRGSGCSVLPYLLDPAAGTVHHTLLISPPQQGKTTLLRDLARLISSGEWPSAASGPGSRFGRGRKVGIIDERSELAACDRGVPRFDVGPRTDVMDACPKAEGMMMMIRSMSPEILVVDEIGREEDALAVHEAVHAGIRVIASAHAFDLRDAKRRPVLQELMTSGVFDRIVTLRKRGPHVSAISVTNGLGSPVEPAGTGPPGDPWGRGRAP